jgi:hypothetical protein
VRRKAKAKLKPPESKNASKELAARKTQCYLSDMVAHITNLSSKISAEASGNTYESGVLFRVATPGYFNF